MSRRKVSQKNEEEKEKTNNKTTTQPICTLWQFIAICMRSNFLGRNFFISIDMSICIYYIEERERKRDKARCLRANTICFPVTLDFLKVWIFFFFGSFLWFPWVLRNIFFTILIIFDATLYIVLILLFYSIYTPVCVSFFFRLFLLRRNCESISLNVISL